MSETQCKCNGCDPLTTHFYKNWCYNSTCCPFKCKGNCSSINLGNGRWRNK